MVYSLKRPSRSHRPVTDETTFVSLSSRAGLAKGTVGMQHVYFMRIASSPFARHALGLFQSEVPLEAGPHAFSSLDSSWKLCR